MQLQYLAIVTLAAFCYLAAARDTQIVDPVGDEPIEPLAWIICTRNHRGGGERHKQISRPQTIIRLSEFLRDLPYGHALFSCRQKFGQSLEDLKHLLTTGNQNVCGDEKISLLEVYHRHYVSTLRKHRKESEAQARQTPRLARLFFMHYAQLVSRVCEISAVKSLAASAHLIDEDAPEVDAMLNKLRNDLSLTNPSSGYQNFVLFWKFVERLPFKGDERLADYINSNGRIKLSVAVHSADKLQSMRALCQAKFKPIYQHSVLPVLRLIDMGYYPEQNLLRREALSSQSSRRLFELTQLCEIILPIRPFNDATLSPGSVNVLRQDEAEVLSAGAADIVLDSRPIVEPKLVETSENSLESMGQLPTVTPTDASRLIQRVQLNVDSRNKALKMVLKKTIGTARSKIKSKVGSFLVSGKRKSLELHKLVSLKSLDGEHPHEDDNTDDGALVRRKRGFFRSLGREVREFVREHKVGITITIIVIVIIIILIALGALLFIG